MSPIVDRSRASAVSSPTIIRKSVVLPAPLAPMIPTIPALGSENDRSSIRILVAVALAQALDLDDRVAEARPGRDGDLELAVVGLVGVRLGQQLLVGTEAGLALGLPGARGQAHPFELAGEGALAGIGGASPPRRAESSFCSSQLE